MAALLPGLALLGLLWLSWLIRARSAGGALRLLCGLFGALADLLGGLPCLLGGLFGALADLLGGLPGLLGGLSGALADLW